MAELRDEIVDLYLDGLGRGAGDFLGVQSTRASASTRGARLRAPAAGRADADGLGGAPTACTDVLAAARADCRSS